MNWTQLLKSEIETTYTAAAKLLDMVDPGSLDWKPATGENWMTTGQLLMHLAFSCGAACKGFITGDWGMPEDVKVEDLPPEEMLPPAEKMPAVASVEEAKKLLEEDKVLALRMVDETSEEDLAGKEVPTPWAPDIVLPLGLHLLHMIWHLGSHKGQLFYYLKLQGKRVGTPELWGGV